MSYFKRETKKIPDLEPPSSPRKLKPKKEIVWKDDLKSSEKKDQPTSGSSLRITQSILRATTVKRKRESDVQSSNFADMEASFQSLRMQLRNTLVDIAAETTHKKPKHEKASTPSHRIADILGMMASYSHENIYKNADALNTRIFYEYYKKYLYQWIKEVVVSKNKKMREPYFENYNKHIRWADDQIAKLKKKYESVFSEYQRFNEEGQGYVATQKFYTLEDFAKILDDYFLQLETMYLMMHKEGSRFLKRLKTLISFMKKEIDNKRIFQNPKLVIEKLDVCLKAIDHSASVVIKQESFEPSEPASFSSSSVSSIETPPLQAVTQLDQEEERIKREIAFTYQLVEEVLYKHKEEAQPTNTAALELQTPYIPVDFFSNPYAIVVPVQLTPVWPMQPYNNVVSTSGVQFWQPNLESGASSNEKQAATISPQSSSEFIPSLR